VCVCVRVRVRVCVVGKGGSWLAEQRSVANKLSEMLVYVCVCVCG